jgi:hypothetical protein
LEKVTDYVPDKEEDAEQSEKSLSMLDPKAPVEKAPEVVRYDKNYTLIRLCSVAVAVGDVSAFDYLHTLSCR